MTHRAAPPPAITHRGAIRIDRSLNRGSHSGRRTRADAGRRGERSGSMPWEVSPGGAAAAGARRVLTCRRRHWRGGAVRRWHEETPQLGSARWPRLTPPASRRPPPCERPPALRAPIEPIETRIDRPRLALLRGVAEAQRTRPSNRVMRLRARTN